MIPNWYQLKMVNRVCVLPFYSILWCSSQNVKASNEEQLHREAFDINRHDVDVYFIFETISILKTNLKRLHHETENWNKTFQA